ncbi:MAG: type II secretion system F family protein [Mycobacterium sp.]
MTGASTAALLLATAALVTPTPARARAGVIRPVRVPGRLATVIMLAAAVAVAMVANAALVVAGAAVGGTVLIRRRRRLRDSGRRTEVQAMAVALDVLVGELRIGAHPVRAFGAAAADSCGVVGEGMRTVAARARLGADVGGGLHAVAPTSSVPAYWHRLAVFWQLAHEHGLPISVLMTAAQRDTVDRQQFSDRINAALAGARATAAILALLPMLGVLFGQLIGAHPFRVLLGGGMGNAVSVVGMSLILAGVAWSDRIVERLDT